MDLVMSNWESTADSGAAWIDPSTSLFIYVCVTRLLGQMRERANTVADGNQRTDRIVDVELPSCPIECSHLPAVPLVMMEPLISTKCQTSKSISSEERLIR